MTATRHTLPDGRLHLQHGPIDLVIAAEGDARAVAAAHAAAWARFPAVLPELVSELAALREPVDATSAGTPTLRGPIARRMRTACRPHAAAFITPMAAVAGSVAEEIVACYRREGIARAWINNGGDIALHLAPGTSVTVGLVADVAQPAIDARFVVDAALCVRGIATSGWRGRSLSLGIADSVTVLAATASAADAAATMIANAVDIAHPGIVRMPAVDVRDQSDLGALLVTVDVPVLEAVQADAALDAGYRHALALQRRGTIVAAMLTCQGRRAWLSPPAHSQRLAA